MEGTESSGNVCKSMQSSVPWKLYSLFIIIQLYQAKVFLLPLKQPYSLPVKVSASPWIAKKKIEIKNKNNSPTNCFFLFNLKKEAFLT